MILSADFCQIEPLFARMNAFERILDGNLVIEQMVFAPTLVDQGVVRFDERSLLVSLHYTV